MASQKERILEMLGDNRWHCGNEFLEAYMPRYSAVIHTLRHELGYDIEGKACDMHTGGIQNRLLGHNVFMFRIVSYPANLRRGEQISWIS